MKPRDFRPRLRRGVSWRTLLIGSANTTPRDQDKKLRNRFSRRALLIGAGQVGLFGLLTWRLRQLQIKDSSEYRLLSDENRLRSEERRVGKECRSRWWAYTEIKNTKQH